MCEPTVQSTHQQRGSYLCSKAEGIFHICRSFAEADDHNPRRNLKNPIQTIPNGNDMFRETTRHMLPTSIIIQRIASVLCRWAPPGPGAGGAPRPGKTAGQRDGGRQHLPTPYFSFSPGLYKLLTLRRPPAACPLRRVGRLRCSFFSLRGAQLRGRSSAAPPQAARARWVASSPSRPPPARQFSQRGPAELLAPSPVATAPVAAEGLAPPRPATDGATHTALPPVPSPSLSCGRTRREARGRR